LVAGTEPFIQTSSVELLLAGSAGKFGKLVVGSVKDVETNVTFLNPLKSLVNILLPDIETSEDGSILISQECCQL